MKKILLLLIIGTSCISLMGMHKTIAPSDSSSSGATSPQLTLPQSMMNTAATTTQSSNPESHPDTPPSSRLPISDTSHALTYMLKVQNAQADRRTDSSRPCPCTYECANKGMALVFLSMTYPLFCPLACINDTVCLPCDCNEEEIYPRTKFLYNFGASMLCE